MEKLFEMLFENDELLVVNKPAGLVCHPTKNGEMSSLIGRARLHLKNSTQPHLVNRLDRETSGVVMIAKNSEAAGELGKILESRAVEKEYLAIVHGHMAAEQGIIDAPLGKDEQSQVAVKDCVRSDGASAKTEFFVECRFEKLISREGREVGEGKPGVILPDTAQPFSLSALRVREQWEEGRGEVFPFSLLRIQPRTGRKHQIRIHLAHMGHPVVGDKLYGGDEDCYLAFVQNRLTGAQRVKLILENHALHARAIKFNWRGKSFEFSCEPEKWFADFIATKTHRVQTK